MQAKTSCLSPCIQSTFPHRPRWHETCPCPALICLPGTPPGTPSAQLRRIVRTAGLSLNRVAMDSTPSTTNKVIPIVAAPPDETEVFLYAATKKIHPRSVSGLFAHWRWGLVFLTQIVFYGLPWLEWGQRQAVLFDLGARRFYLFGIVLYPQDFIYLTGLLVISALSLFLFTAVAGRLWCGYACPQTVYTEIFLWIERRFEGDRMARIRLDEARCRSTSCGGVAASMGCGWPWPCGRASPSWAISRRCAPWAWRSGPTPWGPGRPSGCCSMALPPMAMPASCASRCASTCAPMPVSRAPCSTRTP